jgi:hypothetical protein
MTKNKNNIEGEQVIASSSKKITSTEITENLDKIIEENEKLSVISSSSESKKNIGDEIKDNKLYHMSPEKRKQLGENFSGLDKVLYDRLEKKVGTRQYREGERVGVGSFVGGLSSVPILGTVLFNVAMQESDDMRKQLERSFTIEEVKEIVRELGIDKNVENTALLEQTKQQIIDLENIFKEKIETEKKNSQKLKEDGEKELKTSENNFSALQKEKNRLTSTNKNLTTQLNKTQSQLAETEITLCSFQEQIEEINKELLQTKNERDDYELKWDLAWEKVDHKREIIKQLLKQIEEERDIHGDAMKAMDRWYRTFISQEEKELLEISKQNKDKEKLIAELENENQIIQQLATAELKNYLELFINIQKKKQELKQLKNSIKTKLKDNVLLKNLLNSQELLTSLQTENGSKITLKLVEKQLQQLKEQLKTKLTAKEINSFCQLQTEITKLEIELINLEMELEIVGQEKLEAKVEILPWNV